MLTLIKLKLLLSHPNNKGKQNESIKRDKR